jgi:hypothetical protein
LVNPAQTPHRLLSPAALVTVLLQAFFVRHQLSAPAGTLENSDNLTRLVEVRDLMAGQGWFDLMQYRLGVAPGVEMHWSRLVDAPIAILIWLGNIFGVGENLAYYAWPTLTCFAAVAAILYGFRRLAPDLPLLSACVIGGFALIGGGAFQPGAYDHHNIQTALALWMIALLLPGPVSARNHAVAGVLAAAMLAIGMETLPYVVAASAYLALAFLADQNRAHELRAFGLGVAGSIALMFIGLVAPSHYSATSCDSLSAFHLVMAASGGLMMAGLAQMCLKPRPLQFRMAGLAAIAAVTFLLLLAFFPHCLADPLQSLDPRLKTFWLDGVLEAQGLSAMIARDPFMLPGLFGLPLAGLIVSLWAIRARIDAHAHILFALMIAAAILITCWQMRGSLFALPFAAMPLALLVGRLSLARARPLKLLSAWLVSLSLFWGFAGSAAAKLVSGAPPVTMQALASGGACHDPALLAPIAGEPAGTLLGNTNFGPVALSHTDHRVLAGPYHRNSTGNLVLIEAMTATPERALELMRATGVTLVAVCSGGPDENDFTAFAPQGFLAKLTSGTKFDWLEPVESSQNQPLRFWRLKS